MPHDALEILLAHRMIDALAVALLNNPHRRFGAVFNRRFHASHPRDVGQVLSGHRRVEVAVREKDVLRVAAASLFANDAHGLGADFFRVAGFFRRASICSRPPSCAHCGIIDAANALLDAV